MLTVLYMPCSLTYTEAFQRHSLALCSSANVALHECKGGSLSSMVLWAAMMPT